MNIAGLRESACPCGSADYRTCCGRLHDGSAIAATALVLMRARYSAYVMGRLDFVRTTWHPETRPADLQVALGNKQQWLGLEIREFVEHGDALASVEFVARYRIAGRGHRLHEKSRFIRVAGNWLYRDGENAGIAR